MTVPSLRPLRRVEIEPNPGRIRVRFSGEIVADSHRTLLIREANCDPVIYFPREDVRFQWLEATDHQSICPFKGEASYWTIRVGERTTPNAAWSYESPLENVAKLGGHLAFYADRVEWQRDEG